MVEGARLESVYAGNRIAGSNPVSTAIFYWIEINLVCDFCPFSIVIDDLAT